MSIHWQEFESLKNKKDGVAIFYAMVKKDLGIENNPKADLMLSKAWERGHSYGFNEVYINALDLVELIR
jgi:hypothetical protein